MAEDTIIEGDEHRPFEPVLEALEQEVETGLACRGFLRRLWQFAEWDGPPPLAGGATHGTEELWPVEEEE
jgi:hypothetical protein